MDMWPQQVPQEQHPQQEQSPGQQQKPQEQLEQPLQHCQPPPVQPPPLEQHGDDPEAEEPLTRFYVYQTATRLLLVATGKSQATWRVLKFSREYCPPEGGGSSGGGGGGGGGEPQLQAAADPHAYSRQEVAALLRQLDCGNAAHGGLALVAQGCGLAGVLRFCEARHVCGLCVCSVVWWSVCACEQRVGTLGATRDAGCMHSHVILELTPPLSLPHPSRATTCC